MSTIVFLSVSLVATNQRIHFRVEQCEIQNVMLYLVCPTLVLLANDKFISFQEKFECCLDEERPNLARRIVAAFFEEEKVSLNRNILKSSLICKA